MIDPYKYYEYPATTVPIKDKEKIPPLHVDILGFIDSLKSPAYNPKKDDTDKTYSKR